jgi:predicted permease
MDVPSTLRCGSCRSCPPPVHYIRKMTKRREKQLTRTVLLICVSFFVCFLPSALIGECGEFVNKDMPRVHSLKMFSVLLKRPF